MSFHPTHLAATGAITSLFAHLLVFGLGGRATRSMVAGAVLGSLICFFCIWGLLWLISRRRRSSSFWWVTLLDHWCQLRLLNTTASTFGVAALVLVQWWPEVLRLCAVGVAFILLARVAVAWLIRDPDGVRATPQTATPPAVLQAGGDAASDVGTGRRSLAGAREPEAKSAWISRFRLRHYPTTACALLTLVAPFFINARFLEREFLPAGSATGGPRRIARDPAICGVGNSISTRMPWWSLSRDRPARNVAADTI